MGNCHKVLSVELARGCLFVCLFVSLACMSVSGILVDFFVIVVG